MKPTQEQLNDPQWWDANIDPKYDYAFTTGPDWNGGETLIGEVKYGDVLGNTRLWELCIGDDSWVLLAKRPAKPAFVPEVGDECEFMNGNKWSKCKIDYISDDYIVVFISDFNNYEALSKGYHEFRPIKSERELFFDSVKKELPEADTDDLIFAGKLYDAGFIKETNK